MQCLFSARIVKENNMADLIKAYPIAHYGFPARGAGLVAAALFISIAGCSKPVEKAEEIRPVRAMVVATENTAIVAEYSGEVRARVESRLGFRVGGKIIT